MVNYFKTMFTSTNPTSFDSILDCMDTKVTTAMNAKLTKCFIVDEVETSFETNEAYDNSRTRWDATPLL